MGFFDLNFPMDVRIPRYHLNIAEMIKLGR